MLMSPTQKLALTYAVIADVLLNHINPGDESAGDAISDMSPSDDAALGDTVESVTAAFAEFDAVKANASELAAKMIADIAAGQM